MFKRRRILAILGAVGLSLGVVTVATPPVAQALTACPNGWSTPAPLVSTHVTTWCYKLNYAQAPTWIIKAPSQYVHNLESPTSTPGPNNPQPQFTKMSVHNWLAATPSASIVINGSFFDTDAGSTTVMSFPLWNNGGNLQATGKYPPNDPNTPYRRCVAWGQSFSSASATAWNYNNNDWTGVTNNSASQCPQLNARNVALDPYMNDSSGVPRTFIGWDSGNAQLCLLVSVEPTNVDVRNDLTLNGCTPLAQEDGGSSSQLAVRDDRNGGIVDLWQGAGAHAPNRPVPHAIYVDD